MFISITSRTRSRVVGVTGPPQWELVLEEHDHLAGRARRVAGHARPRWTGRFGLP